MSYNLFLDDFREPEDAYLYRLNPIYMTEHWIVVRNYNEFINHIDEHGLPEIISFDHDLGEEHYEKQLEYDQYKEKTGYHCALWLINYCIDNNKKLPAVILIHSMNYTGSLNIKSLFESYHKSLKF